MSKRMKQLIAALLAAAALSAGTVAVGPSLADSLSPHTTRTAGRLFCC